MDIAGNLWFSSLRCFLPPHLRTFSCTYVCMCCMPAFSDLYMYCTHLSPQHKLPFKILAESAVLLWCNWRDKLYPLKLYSLASFGTVIYDTAITTMRLVSLHSKLNICFHLPVWHPSPLLLPPAPQSICACHCKSARISQSSYKKGAYQHTLLPQLVGNSPIVLPFSAYYSVLFSDCGVPFWISVGTYSTNDFPLTWWLACVFFLSSLQWHS